MSLDSLLMWAIISAAGGQGLLESNPQMEGRLRSLTTLVGVRFMWIYNSCG